MKLAESHAIILLFLILLVSSSLCIDIINISGIEFQNVQTTEKTEKKTSDVIVIQRVETIPKPPVLPDDSVELYITLANNDEQETIKGSVELFDYSIFIPLDATKKDFTLLPLAEKVIKFSLKAPSAEQIANVKVTPRVSFRVNYTFTGVTTYEIVVVNYEEIKKYQQAGKTLNLVTNKIIGSGPIKIDTELVGSDFILAERSGTLKFTIRNEGTGDLKGNKIEKDKMQITFPKGIRVAPPPRATTTTTLPEKGTSCSNPIDLGSVSKSASISKTVSIPPYKTTPGDNPRWYKFTASDTGEISIKVTPEDARMGVSLCDASCYCFVSSCCNGLSRFQTVSKSQVYYLKIDSKESSEKRATITIRYTGPTTTTITLLHCDKYKCNPGSPCAFGEGDCDYDSDCKSGLICGDNLGAEFGYDDWSCDICVECTEDSHCSGGKICCLSDEINNKMCEPSQKYRCITGKSTTTTLPSCPYTCMGVSECAGYGGKCNPNYYCDTGCCCEITVQQSANPLELIHVLNNFFRRTGMATGWEIKEYPKEYFNCTGNVCSNGEGAIELYQRESSPLLFKITAPSVDVYRTFQIKAEVNYEYELRGYADIEIQPLE